MSMRIDIAGHAVDLLAQRCAFLPGESALVVADAHIGKAVSFRALGVPVPRGTTTENLEALTRLVRATGAARIIFLGDFLHSRRSHAPATLGALAQWRREHAGLHLTLVRGNHDDRAGDPPAELGFEVVDEPLRVGALALCHYPQEIEGAYVLAGHVHPCILVGGRARDRLRLPCFHVGHGCAVLPAFGSFTGMHPIEPASDDRIFAIVDDSVRELPRSRVPACA